MLRLCCFLCLVGVFSGVIGGLNWNSLYVKYGPPDSTPGVDSYFPLPTTSSQAQEEGWVEVPKEDTQSYSIWCMDNDPRMCILYNSYGIVAGLEISIMDADVPKNFPYDYNKHPVFKRKTRFEQDIITGRMYMEDPDELAKGGRSSLDDGVATGVWFEIGNDIVAIPRQESEIKKTKYVTENCVPGMGQHYYYGMHEDMKCEDFEPFFLVVNATLQEMHGIGFQSCGHASYLERMWYETIPTSFVKPTIPTAPECLLDWAEEYGITSIHVYFVEEPWNIPCTGIHE